MVFAEKFSMMLFRNSWLKEIWVWFESFQLGICLVWFDEVSIYVALCWVSFAGLEIV